MKQEITQKQLNALKENQRAILYQWCLDKGYDTTLNIGQLIELIEDKKPIKGISKNRFGKWFVNIDTAQLGYKDELCDALWEAVTRVL